MPIHWPNMCLLSFMYGLLFALHLGGLCRPVYGDNDWKSVYSIAGRDSSACASAREWASKVPRSPACTHEPTRPDQTPNESSLTGLGHPCLTAHSHNLKNNNDHNHNKCWFGPWSHLAERWWGTRWHFGIPFTHTHTHHTYSVCALAGLWPGSDNGHAPLEPQRCTRWLAKMCPPVLCVCVKHFIFSAGDRQRTKGGTEADARALACYLVVTKCNATTSALCVCDTRHAQMQHALGKHRWWTRLEWLRTIRTCAYASVCLCVCIVYLRQNWSFVADAVCIPACAR